MLQRWRPRYESSVTISPELFRRTKSSVFLGRRMWRRIRGSCNTGSTCTMARRHRGEIFCANLMVWTIRFSGEAQKEKPGFLVMMLQSSNVILFQSCHLCPRQEPEYMDLRTEAPIRTVGNRCTFIRYMGVSVRHHNYNLTRTAPRKVDGAQ